MSIAQQLNEILGHADLANFLAEQIGRAHV